MAAQFDPLLDLLVQNGVLDKDGVETIREEQVNSGGKTVREIIVDGGYLDEDSLLGMMAAYQGCEVVDLANMELDDDVVNAIPASIARMYNVICVGADVSSVTLATTEGSRYHSTCAWLLSQRSTTVSSSTTSAG